ncbi:MAG: hypothetical protein R3C11_01250 [Planctomycetaceae bacterium]
MTELSGHTRRIKGIALNSTGSKLVSIGDDGRLNIWNADNYELEQALLRDKLDDLVRLSAVSISPDDQYIAIGDLKGKVRLFQSGNSSPVMTFQHRDQIRGLTFTKDGRWIACNDFMGFISVWPLNETVESRKKVWKAHSGRVNLVAVSPEDSKLYSLGEDGKVLTWKGITEHTYRQLDSTDRYFYDVEIVSTPDGEQLLTLSTNKLELWDPVSAQVKDVINFSDFPVTTLALSHDSRIFAAANSKGQFVLYDLWDKRVLKTWQFPGINPSQMKFSPSKEMLAVVDTTLDSKMRFCLFDLASASRIENLPDDIQNTIAFSKDDKFLYFSNDQNQLCVWDFEQQKVIQQLKGHEHGIKSIISLKSDHFIASSGGDRMIRIWENGPWTVKDVLNGHNADVEHMISGEFERRLFTAGSDNCITVWNTDEDSFERLIEIDTGDYSPVRLSLSEDNKYLVALVSRKNFDPGSLSKVTSKVRIYDWINNDASQSPASLP